MNNIKGSFQFWPNYYKAIKASTNQAYFALAIIRYFYEKVDPMFQDEQDVLMWDLILPSITRSRNNATRNQGAPEGNHNNPNGRRGKTNPETNPIINPETKQIEIEEEIEENNNYLMDYTSNNHEEQFDSINNRGRSGGVIDEDYPSSL